MFCLFCCVLFCMLDLAVPVEKVVERIQLKEIPVVETEERVVEVVREIPVEIVKEVPVYIKVKHLSETPKYLPTDTPSPKITSGTFLGGFYSRKS